ncbi:MAG: GNAT family N-acyltransferase [Bdellovibrionota bacterium]|nr:GNAT family N-acyltransferase [Bdellovibrionota bacterium]
MNRLLVSLLFLTFSANSQAETPNRCHYSASQQLTFLEKSKIATAIVNRLTGITKTNKRLDVYDQTYKDTEVNFWKGALEVQKISVQVRKNSKIQNLGKVGDSRIVVANHPTGLMDGIAIGYLTEVLANRKDVKILYNEMLSKLIPDIKDKSIELDITSKSAALRNRKNAKAIQEAINHVKNGGLLVVFPAGTVSSFRAEPNKDLGLIQRLRKARVTDSVWRSTAAEIALATKTEITPIYFEQRNSLLWHALSSIDSSIEIASRILTLNMYKLNLGLRLIFGMINEFHKIQPGTQVYARIGDNIKTAELFPKKVTSRKSPESFELNELMRKSVYELAKEEHKEISEAEKLVLQADISRKIPTRGYGKDIRRVRADLEYINYDYIPSQETAFKALVQARENGEAISLLRKDYSGNDFEMIWIKGENLNQQILNRLGIDRKTTFSEVGEGSDKKLDIDEFDILYNHLILVNHSAKEIVGAYRGGETAKLYAEFGVEGVYSHEFFQYDTKLFTELNAVDFGRTYILKKYQKGDALLAIWSGLAEYLVLNPQIRAMVGPVSISQSYTVLSQNIIAAYYLRHHGVESIKDRSESEIIGNVRPPDELNPFQALAEMRNKDEISKEDFANIKTLIDEGNPKAIDKFIEKLESVAREKLLEKMSPEEAAILPEISGVPPLLKFYTSMTSPVYSVANFDHTFKTIDLGIVVLTSVMKNRSWLIYLGRSSKEKFRAYQDAQNELYPGWHKEENLMEVPNRD